MMEMNELEPLGRIQKVAPPPFLLTRIEAKITRARAERLPTGWAISLGISLLVLITANTVAYQRSQGTSGHGQSDVQQLATDLSLSPSEQFYR